MKLKQLHAKFITYETRREVHQFRKEDGTDEDREVDQEYHVCVDTLPEADGVQFLCPLCFDKNQGIVGTHSVLCWFVGKVPDHIDPKPGRWTPQGNGLDDLTFVPGDPPRAVSVALTGEGCPWHGFVRNGEATLS